MRRAHASPDANRKRFMIRTSLRISLWQRNRTLVKVIAARAGVTITSLLSFAKERRPSLDLAGRITAAKRLKIFIDRFLRKWLKVGSSGVKWAITPCDQWTPIPNPNASMLESFGIPLTKRIGLQSHRVGDAIVLKISFFCLRRHTSFCWSCRQRSSRK